MLGNYILIGYRNLIKTKLFTFINVLGLALSLTCALLILFFVYDELTYDHYHQKSERIVRLASLWITPENSQEMVITSQALGPALATEMPEVEAYCRLEPIFPNATIKHQGKEVPEPVGFFSADSNVFELFTFNFIEGNGRLANPGDMVINEKTAIKYFGSVNATGQLLVVNDASHVITGVFEDFPDNVDFTINAMIYKNYPNEPQWLQFSSYTYVLLHSENEFEKFASNLGAFASKNYDAFKSDFGGGMTFGLKAQKLRDIHFSKAKMMDAPKGNLLLVQIFIASGLFLLLIAIFNFMNLTTIRAIDRTKEVGIRKTAGAGKKQLVMQFLIEYGIMVIIAILVAISLLQLALPSFNAIMGKNFHAGQIFTDNIFWLLFLTILFIPLLVTVYPGLVIAGLNTSHLLKGKINSKVPGLPLYKSLIFLQFVVSGVLLMGIYAVQKQMKFVEEKPLGYDAKNVTILNLADDMTAGQMESYLNDLNNTQGIKKASLVGSGGVPASGAFFGNIRTNHNGNEKNYVANLIDVDEHYIDVMGMEIVIGQDFSDLPVSMQDRVAIVNETFVKMVGWEEAIGKYINSPISNEPIKVVGVVRDFHYNSLHAAIEPILICWRSVSHSNFDLGMVPIYVMVKLDDKNEIILKSLWEKHFADHPAELTHLSDSIENLYKQEYTMKNLFTTFTTLAILITCLGLFGLSQYVIQLRTKEIGIRKVLGASVSSIVQLLSLKFMVLVFVALVVAVPLAWWGIGYWLDNFAYHIPHSADMFFLPIIAVISLAFMAIGSKTLAVAKANPVESLRNE